MIFGFSEPEPAGDEGEDDTAPKPLNKHTFENRDYFLAEEALAAAQEVEAKLDAKLKAMQDRMNAERNEFQTLVEELEGARRMSDVHGEELCAAMQRATDAELEADALRREASAAAADAAVARDTEREQATQRLVAAAARAAAEAAAPLIVARGPRGENGEEGEPLEHVEVYVDEEVLARAVETAVEEAAHALSRAEAESRTEGERKALATAETAAHKAEVAAREAAQARAAALCAEEAAMASIREARDRAAEAVKGATERVTREMTVSLTLSEASAASAQETAARAASAANAAMVQQEAILRRVRVIKSEAAAADERAHKSHTEALALRTEVEALRKALEEANTDLAVSRADRDKTQLEAERLVSEMRAQAAERVWKAEEVMSRQLEAALQSYEALKAAANEKAKVAEEAAQRQDAEVLNLSKEVEELRLRLGGADAAVAQATSQLFAYEKERAKAEELRDQAAKEQVNAELDRYGAFREGVRAQLEEQMLKMTSQTLKEAKAELDAAKAAMQAELEELKGAVTKTEADRAYWRRRSEYIEERFRELRTEVRKVLQVDIAKQAGKDAIGKEAYDYILLSSAAQLATALEESDAWLFHVQGHDAFPASKDGLPGDGEIEDGFSSSNGASLR